MGLFKQLLNIVFGEPQAIGQQRMAPSPSQSTPAQPQPALPAQPDSGHTERKQVVYRHIVPGEPLVESDNQWLQRGNVMEGISTEVKHITTTGEIVEANQIKGICGRCSMAESDLVRSEVSSIALCRRCRTEIELSDGRTVFVSEEEKRKAIDDFDTWEAFDNKVKVPRR